MWRESDERAVFLVCCVALLVASAGCAGFRDSSTATQTDEGPPAVVTNATATLDEETGDALRETLTDDGTLTATGEQFLERLDVVLASPEPFATEVLASGLTDTDGDGLLCGEIGDSRGREYRE